MAENVARAWIGDWEGDFNVRKIRRRQKRAKGNKIKYKNKCNNQKKNGKSLGEIDKGQYWENGQELAD